MLAQDSDDLRADQADGVTSVDALDSSLYRQCCSPDRRYSVSLSPARRRHAASLSAELVETRQRHLPTALRREIRLGTEAAQERLSRPMPFALVN